MKFELSLMTIAAVTVLALFIPQSDVALHAVEIGLSNYGEEWKLSVDPVWVVDTEAPLLQWPYGFGVAGRCIGNVVLINAGRYKNLPRHRAYILAHELAHVKQYRALGWLIVPAFYMTNIEPDFSKEEGGLKWWDPEQSQRLMWSPDPGAPDLWNFLTVVFGEEA